MATWAFDEKRMSVSRYEDQAYEYRLTIATAGTLALCALGLVAVTILFAAGDRFEYRPSVSNITQPDDNLVRSFKSLEFCNQAARGRHLRIEGKQYDAGGVVTPGWRSARLHDASPFVLGAELALFQR